MDEWSRRLSVLAVAAAAGLPARAAAAPYAGTFALQGATPAIAMHLDLTRGATPLEARVDIWATRSGDTATLTRYDTTHTKKIHLVVVSDDLTAFMHVHPPLRAGHFVEVLHVPHAALYHIYADVTPTGFGQQVYRFDVAFGSGGRTAPATIPPTREVDGRTVSREARHGDLADDPADVLAVTIAKDGKPARDLTAYLGAAAHAVLIHPADWTYLHVHPESGAGGAMPAMARMSGMPAPSAEDLPPTAPVAPTMTLHVNARERGAYRCWLEFRGGGTVYDAAFSLIAR